MKVYIYDWSYVVQKSVTYYIGFGITDDDERVSVVNSMHAKFFYAETERIDAWNIRLPMGVVAEKEIHKRLRNTTPNIYYKISCRDVELSQEVAEFLKRKGVKLYEHELDPITEFINRNDFVFTGWYDITPTTTHNDGILTRQKEHYVRMNNMTVIEYQKVPIMRIMSMDIETYSDSEYSVPLSHNPLDQVRVIGTVMKFGDTYVRKAFVINDNKFELEGVEVQYFDNQYDLIKGYFVHLWRLRPEIVVGFNHMGYDYAFLVDRFVNTSLKHPSYSLLNNHRLRAKHIVWTNTAFNTTNLWMFNCPGVIDIDIMQYAIKEQSFKGYSLNEVAKQVVGETKFDMDHNLMHHYFASHDPKGVQEVVKYCIQDCELPIKIFERNLIQVGIMERARVERILSNSIYTMGSAARMIGQLHYECKGKYILDKTENERIPYEGATVMDPTPGIYEHCATVDFTSLYPSIIISENICYTTYVQEYERQPNVEYNYINLNGKTITFLKKPMGIIPSLLVKLIEQRKAAKAMMKTCAKEDVSVWDKRQWAYKIVANSIYGLMGSHDKHLMFQEGAQCVTSMGRKHLMTARSTLDSFDDVTVFYGDTDSCFIKIHGVTDPDSIKARCKELCQAVNTAMSNKVSLEHENSFRKMIIQGKKNYIGQRYDGSIYYKGGQAVRKNSSKFLKELLLNIVKYTFEKDLDFVYKYIDDKIDDLLSGRVSIDEIKIGMLINENVISPQFKELIKHMDNNLILYKPNQRIYYVYITSNDPKHTNSRRNADWVEANNISICYHTHYTYEIQNPLEKLKRVLGL